MGTPVTGYYHIYDGEKLVVTRKVTAMDDGEGPELALAREAQFDPFYMVTEDVRVNATVAGDDDEPTGYTLGFTATVVPDNIDKEFQLPDLEMPGQCANPQCGAALISYKAMCDHGITKCPYCNRVFTFVDSNPYHAVALTEALGNGDRDPAKYYTPIFELPYGFPRPQEVTGDKLGEDYCRQFTEQDGLELILPEVHATLTRHHDKDQSQDEEQDTTTEDQAVGGSDESADQETQDS